MKGIWAELGIAADSDRDTIRRAYARKLRVTNPEDDAEGFKRLRAAYEQALQHAEWVGRWGDEDDEDDFSEAANGFSLAEIEAMAQPLDRPEPMARWDDPAPSTADDSAETRALHADRDRDLAALRATMAELDNALRGVWRAPDADIERSFGDLLASPAMGEIAARDDVERWTARLIADTIPKSDAILAQAVAAFGWNDQNAFRGDYAVHEVLARLEEWRLIAALGKPTHKLHFAWKTLTRKPVWRPLWRFQALSPGHTRDIRTLLGDFGPVSPGLHFSFNAASVERWQAFFAKPRLTGAMLLLAFAVWIGVHFGLGTIPALHRRVPYAVGGVVAALSLAAPWIALHVARQTHRLEQVGNARSSAFRIGWAAAFAVLGIGAILLPTAPAGAIAVAILSVLIFGWMVVAADPAAHTPFWPSAGRWVPGGILYLIFGLPAAATLPAPIQLTLGTVATLAFVVRTTMIEQLRRALDRMAVKWPLLAGVGAFLAIGTAGALATCGRLTMTQGADAALFVGGALTISVLLPALALFGPVYRRWTFGAHIMLAAIFALLAAALIPPSSEPGSAPRKPTASLSSLFETPTPASIFARLIEDRPNLVLLEHGNPAAFRQIQRLTEQRASEKISSKELEDGVSNVLQGAYRARMDSAPSALIAEERRVKLLQLKLLRTLSPAACARGDMKELETLPDPVWKRTQAFVIATAATAPASKADLAAGTPVPTAEVLADTARRLNMTPAAVSALLASKTEGTALCDARIAVLESMLTHSDADIGATVRLANKAELRRR